MICTIHQSNLLYFEAIINKILLSDVLVIMKHCQFERSNYQNRFLHNEKYGTLSVANIKTLEPINNKHYVDASADWQRIKRQFPTYEKLLSKFDDCINNHLATCNINMILRQFEIMGIKKQVIYDHETDLKASERLVDLCKKAGADTYLSGPSGKNYMDLKPFEDAGIKVVFQEPMQNAKSPLDVLWPYLTE